VVDALWTKRVRVRAQNEERGVRLSAHIYVSPADIDVILDVTREVAAAGVAKFDSAPKPPFSR
jgi:selenocysteine lyase/cysteine desulfurase